ncbi:MAG: hypothetical protein LBC20_01340 [Planctomycetaceae bacterium]|jgi:hypothetical protein|nr:hypothetical protein [Planctomycetaceae bacterium]
MTNSPIVPDNISINKTTTDELTVSEYEQVKTLNLKNPVIAGILTWLIPGLGHYYQGRTAKAILFFFCIVPTFWVGCVLGSSSETGFARNVYYSWRFQDKRLFFIPQVCLGMAAIPAGLQAIRINTGHPPFFGRFMAPPQVEDGDPTGVPPTLTEIVRKRHFLFELGTYITVIAGLMNLLVIFDAIDGPLVYRPEKKEDENKENKNNNNTK